MNVDDFLKQEFNRRQFLDRSARNAAGVAAGMVGFSQSQAQAAPHERLAVGVIGVRSRGKVLAGELAAFADVDVTTLCDVDSNVLPAAVKAVEGAQGVAPRCERDFRRLLDDKRIDAVVIAVPDHWHALMCIMACHAGKDVYVEKPVSHNVLEGARMVDAAVKYDRVVQSGLQQRSGSHFQSAVELVQSGGIGPVKLAKAWAIHRRKPIGRKPDASVPSGVDYDLWLGPAPSRPFQSNRFHYNWHWFWDYGTGELGNWGAHVLDIARWGLGVELPIRVSATGGKYYFDDDQQTPDTQLVHFTYPDCTVVWEQRSWSHHGIEGRNAACGFYGERGTLIVDRSGWKVYDTKEPLTSDTSDQTGPHLRNFVDCVKSRQQPVADIATGHQTAALCHLGNIAYRLGREIRFDPQELDCGDDEANRLLGRQYREPWELPQV